MQMQYDDMVLQGRDRLRLVIPQGPPKIAKVEAIENAAENIEDFLKSNELSKIFVSYSGNNTEGGRDVADFANQSMAQNNQRLSHTIEVHICTKRMMDEDLTKPGNTMLRLMWTVRVGLVGLKFYQRETFAPYAIKKSWEWERTGGLYLVETFMHENYPGVVAVVRFQCFEQTVQGEDIDPELVWGQYKEFTFEEYSQQDGTTPSIAGTANETTVVS